MARNTIAETATVTSKGQTTVPKAVRRALGIGAGDRIAYEIRGNIVTLRKVEREHFDPALGAFLKLIEKDIAAGRNVAPISPKLRRKMRRVLREVDVDLAEPIDGPVDI